MTTEHHQDVPPPTDADQPYDAEFHTFDDIGKVQDLSGLTQQEALNTVDQELANVRAQSVSKTSTRTMIQAELDNAIDQRRKLNESIQREQVRAIYLSGVIDVLNALATRL